MTINKKLEENVCTLEISGRLDTVTAPELESVLKEIPAEVTKLVLDFKELEYISSAGLRVLLSAQKAMNRQGEMVVCNVNEVVMDVFSITGFTEILTIA